MNPKQIGLIGAAAMAVGAFLPWAKFTAPFIGTLTKAGVEGGDGWFFVIAAVVVAICASSGQGVPMLIIGILAIGAGAYEVADVADRIAGIDSDLATGSVGTGLWLCIGGAIASVAAGVLMPKRDAEIRADGDLDDEPAD